ncbi:MAG: hypothetical protein NUV46_04470 [Nanoarchaeota archaeon]|nr:hypothetical protein [Nanoarchaeota archaeon]
MEGEKISSVKKWIESLERNMEEIKKVMKSGDEEKFNELKKDSNDLILKINGFLTPVESSLKDKKDKKKEVKEKQKND